MSTLAGVGGRSEYATTATSLAGTSIARSVRRDFATVVDVGDDLVLECLQKEAGDDKRYAQTLQVAWKMVREDACGGLILAIVPPARKVALRFQSLDQRYMIRRMCRDPRHGKNIHKDQEEIRQALREFVEHSKTDRWPLDHPDPDARGQPKDGGIVLSTRGTVLAAAARFEYVPGRWTLQSTGTRHKAAVALAEWLDTGGVVFVRSDAGMVHIMMARLLREGLVYRFGKVMDEGHQETIPEGGGAAAPDCEFKPVDTMRSACSDDPQGLHARSSSLQRLTSRILEWKAFSPELSEKIRRESKPDVVPVLVILLVPVVISCTLMQIPLAEPEAGFRGNLVHSLLVYPISSALCWTSVPLWVGRIMGGLHYRRAALVVFAHTLVSTVLVCTISVWADVYPVPFSPLVTAVTILAFMPLIWYCIPHHVRSGRRMLQAIATCVSAVLIFDFIAIMARLFCKGSSIAAQIGMMLVFISLRFCQEKFCQFVCRIGLDAHPPMVFLSVYACEAATCVIIASGFVDVHLLVASAFVDMLENLYYMYCIHHEQWGGADWEKSREPIMAVLLIRELAEASVPFHFLISSLVMYTTPAKRFNMLVGALEPETFIRNSVFLMSGCVLQFASLLVSLCFLRKHGVQPVRFLRGVVVGTGYELYISFASTYLVFFTILQQAHYGCDMDFKFDWMRQVNATSSSGAA